MNGTRVVLPETRRLVEEAIQSLQYRPNGIARGLQTSKTRTIGVIVANITSYFFAQIVRELEDAFEREHYAIIVCNTDERPEREQRYLEMLFDRRVDGVVMVPTGADQPIMRQFAEAGIPIVSIYRKAGQASGPSVVTDEFASAYTATEHLIELGHRRIGILARGHNLSPVVYRTQGYMQALRAHMIPIDQRLIEVNYRAPERTLDCAKRLFASTLGVTAVISLSLSSTLSLVKSLRQLGIGYPDHVSVLSIGDAPWMEVLPAPLTVMAAPVQELCTEAARLMFEHLAQPRGSVSSTTALNPIVVTVHARLIRRLSCMPVDPPLVTPGLPQSAAQTLDTRR
jgi:DNA-binding LacI/PurR family transcriptional regulator